MARRPRKLKEPKISRRLRRRLVLNRWALDQLGIPLDVGDPIKRLRDLMGGDEHRGILEGHTRYCRAMKDNLFAGFRITPDQLDLYDSSIVALTRRLFPPERTRESFEWTWFQYICLLLTEIYLDRYFGDRDAFCAELNVFLGKFNEQREDELPPFEAGELNKLAFQNATGSGKTHLMHANILQFRHYARRAGVLRDIRNTILITPNEGLSRQHVEKFPDYVFAADLFQKEHLPVLAAGKIPVKVLDYHDFAKPEKKEGPNTVQAERFERANLVLVDEGHRGAKGKETGQWKSRRDELAEDGFSFEYSATFSQAIDSADNNDLKNEYAKSVLFDFSYGEFYKDGYGKEYRILNVEGRAEGKKKKGRTRQIDKDAEFPYLVGALLAFYQQVRYYDEHREKLIPFNIERPLMVLVGASVTAGDITQGELSDVQELLTFLSTVLSEGEEVQRVIDALLRGDSILTDEDGVDAFAGVFDWLKGRAQNAKEIYGDLKRRLFHSGESTLKVTYVTVNGEIRLSVGQAEKPFAIINVGADGAQKVANVCQENLKLTVERDQTSSEALFPKINKLEHIHVLIGSRKFTEGWDSWRVSSMGLLNLGKGEGTQVIQLFGRGVRLKGQRVRDGDGNEKGFSLKRSSTWTVAGKAPAYVNVVETLNVFGVHAKYMATFREMLKNEGADVGRRRTWLIPVIEVFRDSGVYEKLKVPVVPGGERGFRKEVKIPILAAYHARKARWNDAIVLNWFPKTESAISRGARPMAAAEVPEHVTIPPAALAWMDWDRLYFEAQRLKYEVGHNLSVTKADVQGIVGEVGWYKLYLPKQDHEFRFEKRQMWEDIAAQLLQKLLRRLYDSRKAEYDTSRRKYVTLKEATAKGAEYEGVFPKWLITISEEVAESFGEENLAMLNALAEAARNGKLAGLKLPKFLQEVVCERHLYRPLLIGKGKGQVVISPLALDEKERQVVNDVAQACENGVLSQLEVYLLRNGSRGNGIGFVEGGNFYPDFLLWIVKADCQHIVFLDPHGMGREGEVSLKVIFHDKIKEIEQQLRVRGKEEIMMHSYLLSTTDTIANEPDWMKPLGHSELMDRGIVRMIEPNYLRRVLEDVLAQVAPTG